MAIDPYGNCPCGSGKKLKFCCGDLAADLDKVQRMLEGDQPRAALKHLDQVLAKSPRRGSLLDIKATIELSLDEREAASATIQRYLEAEPTNPAAHALAATLAAAEGGQAAVGPLQDAMELLTDSMPRRVQQAIGAVGHALMIDGSLVAARAHLWLYHGAAGGEDTEAIRTLVKLNQVAGMPLLLRDQMYMKEPPPGVAWEAAHDQAQLLASRGQWRRSAGLLEELVSQHADQAVLQYNYGLVAGWLGKDREFVDGLRRYAQLSFEQDGPSDDAIEAEAIAQVVDTENRDQPLDVVKLTYQVTDDETLIDRLTRDQRTVAYQLSESELQGIEGPPPRHTFSLLDRDLPSTGLGIEADDVPRVIGFLSHYGRQTDREERLELVVDRDDRFDSAKQLLANVAERGVAETPAEEVVGEAPVVESALSIRWQFPADTPPDLRRELIEAERRRTLLEVWPNLARAALHGKSPVEAGGVAELRLPLEAAVLNLEQSTVGRVDAEAFRALRETVGLPETQPVPAATVDLDMTPIARLTRVDLSVFATEELIVLYRRSVLCGANEAIVALAKTLLEREPSPQLPREELFHRLVSLEPDPADALAWVERARDEADAAGTSNAPWDITELELRVLSGDMQRANDLIEHLRSVHLNEPGVAEQLYRLLYALGAVPAPGEAAPGVPASQGGPAAPAMAAGPEPEAGKIWTPGDDAPAGGGGQKLWTPS
ncbi:MAG: SEC-C domain-containing protein [Planctomycetota bacterium]